MSFLLGVLAAVAAPMTMTLGFIAWDSHWKGSAFALNMVKCNLASLLFLLVVVCQGNTSALELEQEGSSARAVVGYLFLSSTIGILIGDWTWLEALRLLGAKRVILVDSLKPFLAALLGWAVLGEEFENSVWEIVGVGMLLTVTGVLMVSLEKEDEASQPNKPNSRDATIKRNLETTPSEDGLNKLHEEEEEGSSVKGKINKCPSLESGEAGTSPVTPANGIAVTVTEQPPQVKTDSSKRGYLLAAINVVLDTYGSVLTKEYGRLLSTWEINLLRFGFAGVCMAFLAGLLTIRDWMLSHNETGNKGDRLGHAFPQVAIPVVPKTEHKKEKALLWYHVPKLVLSNQKDAENETDADNETTHLMTRTNWSLVLFGILLVTFTTPALSNYALLQIALALALTLTSIGPLYALPLSWLLQGQRPSLRAWIGTLVALSGVVHLSLRGSIVAG